MVSLRRLATTLDMDLPCGRVGAIDDEHHLWRSVKDDPDCLEWDSDDAQWLPRVQDPSNSVQFNPDLSVFWAEHVEKVHAAGIEVALTPSQGYTLAYSLSAATVRELHLGVVHSPQDDMLPGCAHGSIEYPVPRPAKHERRELRYRLARQMRLVAGSPTVRPPPNA